MGFCQGGVLSDGVLSGWGFVRLGFCLMGFVRVGFCLMGFCQGGVLSDGVLSE